MFVNKPPTPRLGKNSLSAGCILSLPMWGEGYNGSTVLGLKDHSFSGTDCTCTASYTLTEKGWAIATDSSTDKITAEHHKNFLPANQAGFSLSCWVYTDGSAGLLSGRESSTSERWDWYCYITTLNRIIFRYEDDLSFEFSNLWASPAGTVTIGAWNHVALSLNWARPSTEFWMQVNGVDATGSWSYGSGGTPIGGGTNPVLIGGNEQTNETLNGKLTNYHLWNRPLTREEGLRLWVEPFALYRDDFIPIYTFGRTPQTYTDDGTGGVVVAGAASLGGDETISPDGRGILFGGVANVSGSSQFDATGGVVCAGSATVQLVMTEKPDGRGIQFGGENTLINSFTPTGGVVCGGSASVSAVWNIIATGGVIVVQPVFSNGYEYRMSLQVPAGQVSDDIYKFILRAVVTVNPNEVRTGTDFLVTDATGETIYHDLREYDSTSGKVDLLFKATLDASADNDYWLYWGYSE